MLIDIENLKYNELAGCDEVGRGPLAGPVVGATVRICTLDEVRAKDFLNIIKELGVTDSKKISRKKRKIILTEMGIDLSSGHKLVEASYLGYPFSYSIHEVSEKKIDEINILNASLLAMRNSFIDCHNSSHSKLMIDGNKELLNIPSTVVMETIVKGDSKSVLIGLGSIIAKEYRDQLMEEMSSKYPGYGLEKHAGYPTKQHREAIVELGVTPIHRKSFKGVKEYVK